MNWMQLTSPPNCSSNTIPTIFESQSEDALKYLMFSIPKGQREQRCQNLFLSSSSGKVQWLPMPVKPFLEPINAKQRNPWLHATWASILFILPFFYLIKVTVAMICKTRSVVGLSELTCRESTRDQNLVRREILFLKEMEGYLEVVQMTNLKEKIKDQK